MSFLEKHQRNVDLTAFDGKIPVHYKYTLGLAGDKFFSAIKKDAKFVGTHCEECDVIYSPPAVYCERCFASLEDSWVELPSVGTVVAFTVVTEDDQGKELDCPQVIAAIQLDGADNVFIHRICDCCINDLGIGARVQATFKPKKDRKGTLDDIEYFEIEAE